jgi:hypothetical protein
VKELGRGVRRVNRSLAFERYLLQTIVVGMGVLAYVVRVRPRSLRRVRQNLNPMSIQIMKHRAEIGVANVRTKARREDVGG